MTELRALFDAVQLEGRIPLLLRRIELLGLTIGRSTLYDLVAGDIRKRPALETVDVFVQGCLAIADSEQIDVRAEWRNDDWWSDLHAATPLTPSRQRRVVQVGRIPPLANARQGRTFDIDLPTATSAVVLSGTVTHAGSVLSGLGGVGKTQIAAFHAREAVSLSKVDVVVWVDAGSRPTIVDQFRLAAEAVGEPVVGRSNLQAAEQFLVWLERTAKRWLIVLDGLDQPNDLAGLWPPERRGGTTIVTTRRADPVLGEQGRIVLNVGAYSPDEAHDYLVESLAAQPDLADDVDGVAEDLGYLPLALSHAASFIKSRATPCSQYRRRFAERRRLAEVLPSDAEGLPDEYQRTVVATLTLAVDAANTLTPGDAAKRVIELLSVLDGAGIPELVLDADGVRRWLAQEADGSTETDGTVGDGLYGLKTLNLATVEAGILRVHNLVQAIVRDSMNPDRLGTAATAAADALVANWPDPDGELGSRLRANAESVVKYLDTAVPPHQVVTRMIQSVLDSGDVRSAAERSERLHADQVALLGHDHEDALATRQIHASALGLAGDTSGALVELRDLVTDSARVFGASDRRALSARERHAHWLGESGDANGAVDAYEKILADSTDAFDVDDPWMLTIRAGTARWRGKGGEANAAAAAYRALIDDSTRILGIDHPDTLAARHNFARFLGNAGDYAQAAAMCEQLVTDRTRVLGADHPETLTTRNNLAYFRGRAGQPAQAAEEFGQLVLDRTRALGPEHPDTFQARANQAFFTAQGVDKTSAVQQFEDLLRDRLQFLSPDHPDVLANRHNLAHFRAEAGDVDAAITEFEQLIVDRNRVNGRDHADTLTARLKLHEWRARSPISADPTEFEALIADCTRVVGPDHPLTRAAQAALNDLRNRTTET